MHFYIKFVDDKGELIRFWGWKVKFTVSGELRHMVIKTQLINKLQNGIILQSGPKNGPVWALITQRWLPIERRVMCQKFLNVVDKKGRTCIANHLNILCLICLNLHYPWNYAFACTPMCPSSLNSKTHCQKVHI